MTPPVWMRATLAAALIAGVTWTAWVWLRPRPSLDPILTTLQDGRLEDGEAQLRAFLERAPNDPRGNLLLATTVFTRQEGLDHFDPEAFRDALKHARRLRTSDPALAARAKLVEGKLCERLGRFDEAESAWIQALALDPNSEVSWLLIPLYERQDRSRERRGLALRLYRDSPRAFEKRRALLELIRIDVHHQAAAGAIMALAPVVEANPDDFHSLLALGRALAREGKGEEGLRRLRSAVESHPDAWEAWDALLTALEDSGQVETQARTLALAPRSPDTAAWLAKHEGWAAQERSDWATAVSHDRLALQNDPHDMKVGYRLGRVLRMAGDPREAARIEQSFRHFDAARKELRALFEERENELRGSHPGPVLLQQVAALRERMGRPEESRAWHALVLLNNPDDAVSLAAIERIK